METRKRVVIVGAGFAGLSAAHELAGKEVDILIVDPKNYHTFQPLLYQVASAELEPEQVAYPVRAIFRNHDNVDFLLASMKKVDRTKQVLHTSAGKVDYDYLIICTGSTTNFFGTPGAEEYCFNLKTLDQSIAIRNRVMACFETAACETDPTERQRHMNFVIIGGGPTGVELAGALSELIYGPLKKDFPNLDVTQAKIVLLQSPAMLLPHFTEPLQEFTLKQLTKKGVDVRLNSRVSEVTEECVQTHDGCVINSETAIWTAGVSAPAESKGWGLPLSKHGQISVRNTLQIADDDFIFAAGDICVIDTISDGKPIMVPMVAPAAMQQGRKAAHNILHLMEGKKAESFSYFDKGTMATIGRYRAVARLAGRNFAGFFAWILWAFVHLALLIGFKNKVMTMIDWGIDYLTFDKGVRLIMPNTPFAFRKNPPLHVMKHFQKHLDKQTARDNENQTPKS